MRNAQIMILSALGDASRTGSAYDVGQVVSASFVPNFADATAAGTLKLQASNDNPGTQQNFTPSNWSDIPNATSAITSGAGPAIVVPNMAFKYIRAVFTRTAGGASAVVVTMNSLSV